MQPEVNAKLEKLAYSIKLAYELLERVDAGKDLKAMGFVKRHAETIAQPLDDCIQSVTNDQKYKDAISTLQTEFGHVDSVQDILENVYRKCPSLKPKTNE
jgi:UDP:flavonoid glycosyltransferase YjiC (YdhE family)